MNLHNISKMTPEQAKQIIEALNNLGYNAYKIRKLTGMSLETLRDIKNNNKKFIRKSTEQKLRQCVKDLNLLGGI